MRFHINIKSIDYIQVDNYKTKCIIRWINPLTGNIQRSVGISRCNPDDEFNSVLGDRIAEGRAKIKMWDDYRFSARMCFKSIMDRHHKFIVHEYNHIENMINGLTTDRQ